MWMKLRAWWHLRFNAQNIPRDVREYIVQRNKKAAMQWAKTPEQRVEFANKMLVGALSLGTDQISHEMRDELVSTSFQLLDGLTDSCTQCGLALYIHDAVKIEDKLYCKCCRPAV